MSYDLIVIGGGPAGMMAASRAAENGARVLLLEKNDRLGAKLLVTGKGRCNITNAEPDARKFIAHYGHQGKFLFSSYSRYNNQDAVAFFEKRGVATKVERGQRVFPKSDRADMVLKALVAYLEENKVLVKIKSAVRELVVKDGKINKAVLASGEELSALNYLIATGGKSYPSTGSDGGAYEWLVRMGHAIIKPRPALAPIILEEPWIKDLEGLSLKNVFINLYQNNKKIKGFFGEALFSRNGMSGPIVLEMSKQVGELLENGQVELKIDFKPALDEKKLDERIQKDFLEFNNKMFKNSLDRLLPQKLISTIVRLSGIEPEKKVNTVTKAERRELIGLLKKFALKVKKLAPIELAIITAGGVDLKEVDPKTLRSKIIANLYLAGEVLDIDGPTGGFNLQICWSTGYAVGENFNRI